MVARNLRRHHWCEESKQKEAGTAVTGDPFLQGVLAQRTCYSGFCFICGYLWEAVSCKGKAMGSEAGRCWLGFGAPDMTIGDDLGHVTTRTPSFLTDACWKAAEMTKEASRVNTQHCLGYNRGDFLLLPFSFLPPRPGEGPPNGIRQVCWACPRTQFLLAWVVYFQNLELFEMGILDENPQFCLHSPSLHALQWTVSSTPVKRRIYHTSVLQWSCWNLLFWRERAGEEEAPYVTWIWC